MLRVGYPGTIAAKLFAGFPSEVALIPLTDKLDHDVDIDVWIPDPYPTRAQRVVPHLHGVKLVLSLMAGTEWIPSAMGQHVTICNAHGAHNVSTAEWTLSAILALLKYFPLYLDVQSSGIWKRRFEATTHYTQITGESQPHYPPVMQEELTGKTLLLVGFGAIGKEIERILSPFHLEILRIARTARANPPVHSVSDLNSLIPAADIVVLILPRTPESHHLIGPSQLGLMRQGAILVNAARGPIVDTDALVHSLQAGRIRAAVDVTDPEPLPENHPLWKCPNLLLTPHIGASTPQFAPRAIKTAELELRRYMAGEPLLNVVQVAI
ncbi:MAG TPA: NAD(P)-dependent oxidoreductase [Terracidiphilus sp.]|jgi:phosphoglycerate dehydrogenase-like enzyme|nr:NAD(P)-dependent oxidoreductase [Terracidiphilus sp.]